MPKYLVLKMVMSTEESLTVLPTSSLPETLILEERKSNLSREDFCNVINVTVPTYLKLFTISWKN